MQHGHERITIKPTSRERTKLLGGHRRQGKEETARIQHRAQAFLCCNAIEGAPHPKAVARTAALRAAARLYTTAHADIHGFACGRPYDAQVVRADGLASTQGAAGRPVSVRVAWDIPSADSSGHTGLMPEAWPVGMAGSLIPLLRTRHRFRLGKIGFGEKEPAYVAVGSLLFMNQTICVDSGIPFRIQQCIDGFDAKG